MQRWLGGYGGDAPRVQLTAPSYMLDISYMVNEDMRNPITGSGFCTIISAWELSTMCGADRAESVRQGALLTCIKQQNMYWQTVSMAGSLRPCC